MYNNATWSNWMMFRSAAWESNHGCLLSVFVLLSMWVRKSCFVTCGKTTKMRKKHERKANSKVDKAIIMIQPNLKSTRTKTIEMSIECAKVKLFWWWTMGSHHLLRSLLPLLPSPFNTIFCPRATNWRDFWIIQKFQPIKYLMWRHCSHWHWHCWILWFFS